jgi:urease accessory protein
LGLLAGLQNTKGARVILFLVPLGLVAGVALAPLLPPVAVAALVDRASFVILGLLVALGRRLPEGLLAGLAMLFGVSHGYENGLAMSADSLPHLFGPGVALWGLIVVTLTAATAFALGRSMAWVRIAVRAVGSWIAAIGLMVVAL